MSARMGKAGVFIALLLVLVGVPFCCAQAEEGATVRVGYMDYNGFIEEQSDGTYAGYGAEYLAKISEYTGYHYEYVYGEWSDLLEKLKNGDIDLVCTAQYTQDRAAIYDYTAYPIGYTQGLLYARADSDISYEDYTVFDSLKIGGIRGSEINDMFEQYRLQHGFSCSFVEYASDSELMQALSSGEVDAVCSEHLANHKDLSLLAQFGADAYYLMSYKGSPYVSEINYALQQIKTDVDFETDLYHKYYDDSSAATMLQFTTAERDYIATAPTIRVSLNANRAPFSHYDDATSTFSGICVDVLDEIARRSGLKFEYVVQETGATTPDILAAGTCDVVCGVERDNFITNDAVVSTRSFLDSSVVAAGKSGTELDLSSHLTAAIPSSYRALWKTIQSSYPNMDIVGYGTNRECLDAVMAGEADVFIQNTQILSLLLQEPRYETLAILPIKVATEHTAMALSRSADPRLLSVLNKSIENLDDATISASLIEHTFASPYQYTLEDFLYRFRGQIAIIALLLLACFGLMGVVISTKRRFAENLERTNRNLEKAIEKADSANAAKSQFLAQMSHEIRTPMNAIIGLTGIAKTETHSPEQIDEYLTKIDGSSRLLLGLINDILDMSAIEGGKLKIDEADFDFKQMLTDITTVFYQQAKAKKIDFQVRMGATMASEVLVGDELRLKQVLMNLLSNAIKFTPEAGCIKLTIVESGHSHDKVWFRFSVSDTGCGMSEDMLSRLFQPFEQESAATARKHGGSGLGLSITKDLVEMMGGSIHVESVVGEGSTFTVDLPFGTDPDADVSVVSDFSSIRALVVDDDEDSCEYSAMLLERLGVRSEYVSDGDTALELLGAAEEEGDPFQLCLVDWKMPNMDGVDVTRAIREIFGDETIVVIVSAYDLSEVEAEGKMVGADYFVPKPLFQSTLFNALMHIANGSHSSISADSIDDAYDFSGRRVLVAEDVELNKEVIVKLLTMVGIEVVCAEDGKQALEAFEQAPVGYFDCVLMDVNMPVMNGYEATRAIRACGKDDSGTIPIYAMTANAFSEDIAATLDAGMNGHIAKPIDTHVLYRILQSIFDRTDSPEDISDLSGRD